MLCNKKRGTDAVVEEPLSIVDEVIGNEDLAFLISSYLYPTNRHPQHPLNICHKLCVVSKRWHQAFSLVRAQLRYDHLIAHIHADDDNEWIYHKLSYIPGCLTEEAGRTIPLGPREGCLQILRSHTTKTCDDACQEYRTNLLQDPLRDRVDSRADYYYRAHHEEAETVQYILPRPLISYESQIEITNEIKYDEKPRLVNLFTTCIGDVNGMQNPLAGSSNNKSKEGTWNLGYHEIKRVQGMITSSCHPRPPFDDHGKDTTMWLRSLGAVPSDHPRWIKFCHLVGEDHCRTFLTKHLLPMMGSRPSSQDGFVSSLR